MKLLTAIFILSLGLPSLLFAQVDSSIDKVISFPNRLFSKITKRTSTLNQNIEKTTDNYLKRLALQEGKLRQVLNKTDSNMAKKLFSIDLKKQYQENLGKIQGDSNYAKNIESSQYQAYTDSMGITLHFFKNTPQLLDNNSQVSELKNSIQGFNSLQQQIQGSDQLSNYVSQRRVQLKQYLAQQAHVPDELTNLYKDYSNSLYEYSEGIKAYKDELNSPDKIFKRVLQQLQKLPSFQSFAKSNSLLASLFPAPINPSSSTLINGLQSRTQMQEVFQGRIPSNPAAANSLSESVQNAKSQLDDLTAKVAKYGENGGNMDDLNYQKNSNKGKSLLKNLEYEFNFQVQPSTYVLQSYVDLGLGIGYKMGKSNVVGFGFDYHLGYGQPLKNIHLSSQGVGFRLYTDIQMKANIYISGGYEINQNVYDALGAQGNSILWQPSGLLGLSKIVTIKSKLAKKTKVQILWDYLSYFNYPKTPPFKFRIGYAL